ncbi:enoyl-CoA hydratase [Crossiella cryophila]|uniref:Enoyl-CoA hydratase n=1 Tax=Crossiella cryophila TaxID=43355 RepID=A0A7W7FRI9_9PSEU|nr:enoyl-CoA hydratase [Crossiella cryophila]MBB4674408.1 enoyl-CoA hydratase [Crossiella cryophila]
MSAEVLLEQRGRVAVITINAPDRRNALTPAISTRLAEAVTACEHNGEVNAVVVTGAPPAFCAGADLTALGESREAGLRTIYAGFLAVADCALPTIAAVNGAAVGAGLNLALACDVRLAGPLARFDARFLQLGIHPGGGMTWMLDRIVGPQTAMAMALFGQVLDAEAAEKAGLVWARTPGEPADVVDAAVELAAASAGAPRELVLATKQSMRRTAAVAEHAEAVEVELVSQLISMNSPAFAERLAAMKARISGK